MKTRAPGQAVLGPLLSSILAAGLFAGGVLSGPEMTAAQLLKNLKTKSFSGKVVEIDFPAHDLLEILGEFETISGLKFDVDPALPDLRAKRKFTLLGMPWDKSLDLILRTSGLELRAEGERLRVQKAAPEKRAPSVFFLAGAAFAAAVLAAALLIRRKLRRRAKQLLQERKFSLEEARVEDIVRKLGELFTVEKIYRDPDLNLQRLADRLSLPPYLLSWIFNAKMGTTFSDFLNQHRIREIQAALSAPGGGGRTILEIAFDAGFNTKSAFYKAFKKITGMAPGEVQKRTSSRKS